MALIRWAVRRPVFIVLMSFCLILATVTLLGMASDSPSLLAESAVPVTEAYDRIAEFGLLSLSATLIGS